MESTLSSESYIFFHVETKYMINDKLCIRIVSHPNQLALREQYVSRFIAELDHIVTTYGVGRDGIIVLVDMKTISIQYVDLGKVKKIVKLITEKYPDYLHKCIIYNYTDVFKFLMDAIRLFLDDVTNTKIIINNNMEQVLESMTRGLW